MDHQLRHTSTLVKTSRVACNPSRRPDFDPSFVHVEFMVIRLALEQVFPATSIFPVSVISPALLTRVFNSSNTDAVCNILSNWRRQTEALPFLNSHDAYNITSSLKLQSSSVQVHDVTTFSQNTEYAMNK